MKNLRGLLLRLKGVQGTLDEVLRDDDDMVLAAETISDGVNGGTQVNTNGESTLERTRREAFAKISRLSHDKTEAETERFFDRLDWHDLPMNRNGAIVAYFKNPSVYLPEDLNDAAVRGGELVRERASALLEIVALVNFLHMQIRLTATNSQSSLTLTPLERQRKALDGLTQDTIQWVIDLSGKSRIEVTSFVRGFLYMPAALHKIACLDFCPADPTVFPDRESYDPHRTTVETGAFGRPLERKLVPIPVPVPGFTRQQSSAGQVYGILLHLRAEKSRYQDQRARHEREMKAASLRLQRLEKEWG